MHKSGADPGFYWGGGQKIMCAHRHIMSAKPETCYGPLLKALGVLLSCNIWALYFLAFWHKMGGGGEHRVNQKLGVCGLCAPPPPWISHCKLFIRLMKIPLQIYNNFFLIHYSHNLFTFIPYHPVTPNSNGNVAYKSLSFFVSASCIAFAV